MDNEVNNANELQREKERERENYYESRT